MRNDYSCEDTCRYADQCRDAGNYDGCDGDVLYNKCKEYRKFHRYEHDDRRDRKARRNEKWNNDND